MRRCPLVRARNAVQDARRLVDQDLIDTAHVSTDIDLQIPTFRGARVQCSTDFEGQHVDQVASLGMLRSMKLGAAIRSRKTIQCSGSNLPMINLMGGRCKVLAALFGRHKLSN